MASHSKNYPPVQEYAPIVEGLPVLERGIGGVEQNASEVTLLPEAMERPQATSCLQKTFWNEQFVLAVRIFAASGYFFYLRPVIELAASVKKKLRPINLHKRRGEAMVIIKNSESQLWKYPFGDSSYGLVGNDLVILSVKYRNGNRKRF